MQVDNKQATDAANTGRIRRWRKKHWNLTEVENLAQCANTPTRRREDNLERPVMLTVSPLFACLDEGNPEDRNDRSNNR